jgi:hypothetical protein
MRDSKWEGTERVSERASEGGSVARGWKEGGIQKRYGHREGNRERERGGRSSFDVPQPGSWAPDAQRFPRPNMTTDSFLLPSYALHLNCSNVSFRARQYRAVYSESALAEGALACDGFHCAWPAAAARALAASGGPPGAPEAFFEDALRFARHLKKYAGA